jgi:hypothetical protein
MPSKAVTYILYRLSLFYFYLDKNYVERQLEGNRNGKNMRKKILS